MRSIAALAAIVLVTGSTTSGQAAQHRYSGYQAAKEGASLLGNIPTINIDPSNTISPAAMPQTIKPLQSEDSTLRPFLGVWRGQWEGTLDSYYVITQENNGRVKVFYSWGTNSIVKVSGMQYVWGKIYDGVLLLPSFKASISLKLQPDGTLFGLYYSSEVHMPSKIILTH